MTDAADLGAHDEMERADALLREARAVLISRIAGSRQVGDEAATRRYQERLAEVQADFRRFNSDDEFRKTILARYPQVVASLRS